MTPAEFVEAHTAEVEPLERELSIEQWLAATTGNPAHDERGAALHAQHMRIHASRSRFEQLKQWRESDNLADPILARLIDVLYLSYAKGQQDEEAIQKISQLQKEAERTFNTFRGVFDGVPRSDNDLAQVLSTEIDSARLKAAWEATKQIGPAVVDTVLDLVRVRNEAARRAGYTNHYSKNLILNEIDEERLFQILDELATLTAEPYRQMKADLDRELAARYGIAVGDLRPWHYHDPFFQRVPRLETVDLDRFYADKKLEGVAIRSYDGMGMDVRDVLARSDLYARPNKNQHAFCVDIDRKNDIRILCNLEPRERWMETLLHELGHAVYDKFNDSHLPYLIRRPPHVLSTEAIAMLMGRLALDEQWLIRVAGVPPADVAQIAPAVRARQRLGMLIFVRWVLVVCTFERAMYADPDQDLNTLWWDLVERFQMVPRPEGRYAPDWAAKIHLALYPVYYQNYMLGELMASQLSRAIQRDFGGLIDEPRAGRFLIDELFKRGARADWDTTLAQVTGERLSPRHFVEEFV